jgi:DNA repair photolyase
MSETSHRESPQKGRGTGINPKNRFVELHVDYKDADFPSDLDPSERKSPTRLFVDESRSALTRNNSPDIGFEFSLNPYRGCEHGCVYCFARPTHEYLGLSAGVDFESKIFVKEKAPQLLEEEFSAKSWKPAFVALSGVTDPYQPIERKLQLTRRCLQVFAKFLNPVGIITKNHLVTRDLDVLKPLAEAQAVCVSISLTTLDEKLCSTLEPRTSRPKYRLAAIEQLAQAGIPVGIMVAPVIPGFNDEEIPRILAAAHSAGARYAGHVPLRLPFAVKDIFEDWLRQNYPDRAGKVLNRIREMRGGKLNDSQFGSRMQGEGPMVDQMHALFRLSCKKIGIDQSFPRLSSDHFRRPSDQLSLF